MSPRGRAQKPAARRPEAATATVSLTKNTFDLLCRAISGLDEILVVIEKNLRPLSFTPGMRRDRSASSASDPDSPAQPHCSNSPPTCPPLSVPRPCAVHEWSDVPHGTKEELAVTAIPAA
jgi:hypothetical protein